MTIESSNLGRSRVRSAAGWPSPSDRYAPAAATSMAAAAVRTSTLGGPSPAVRWVRPQPNRPARVWQEGGRAVDGAPLGKRAIAALLIYLAALCVAELLTVWRPIPGMLTHTALLMLMLAHSALTRSQVHRAMLLALTLAPLVRIVSLAMPLGNFPQVSWYLIVSLPLFTAAAVIARLANLGRRDLGLVVDVAPAQWLIMSAGIPLGAIEYVILRPQPLVAGLVVPSLWLPALILVVSTGFLEELVFRGLLQHVALRAFGGGGIVYVSALFAALHIGHRSALDVGFVLLVALLFADARRRTGSLLGVTIAHGLTNSLLFLICPFLLGS
jgi:membrane protease YdiL (CAAX protease family)